MYTILQKRKKQHWDKNGVNLPKFIKNEYFIKHKSVNYLSEALNNVFVITYGKASIFLWKTVYSFEKLIFGKHPVAQSCSRWRTHKEVIIGADKVVIVVVVEH